MEGSRKIWGASRCTSESRSTAASVEEARYCTALARSAAV